MTESAKAKLCHVLADCFAHGHGVGTNFEKALEYLDQAARHGNLSAEAILPRITCAIRGLAAPPMMGTLSRRDDAAHILLRQRVSELERRLHCQTNSSNNLAARVRAWTKWDFEIAQTRLCTFQHDEGYTLTIPETTEISFLRLLESNQLKPLSGLVTISTIFYPKCEFYLAHIFSALGWIKALDWIRQHDIRHLSSHGGTVLTAAANGQADAVRFLLANGEKASPAEDSTQFAHHINGLHFLSWFEDPDVEAIAGLLFTHGANPNMVSPTGESKYIPLAGPDFFTSTNGPPLDMAIALGDRRAVGVLLKLGADPLLQVQPNVDKHGHTPLKLAVALHLYDIVDDILTHISSTSPAESRPWKALLVQLSGHILGAKAMFWRWLLHGDGYQTACHNTIEVCLKHGATLNYDAIEDASPLHAAAFRGSNQLYVLEALLLHEADPNVQHPLGQTALASLNDAEYCPEDRAAAMKILIGHGAQVNLADRNGMTPLHAHTAANSTTTLRILLDHGANVEAKSDRERTPLHLAARYGHVECLNILLDHGADIDALSLEHPSDPTSNDDTGSALDAAAWSGHASCVRALLDRGPGTLAPQKAGLALRNAIYKGRLEVFRVLWQEYPGIFAKKVVVQAFDTQGGFPLHYAAAGESMTILNEVLRVRPELDFRDNSNPTSGTALDAAVASGRIENAILLVESGATPFCQGDPAEENSNFIRKFISSCASKYDSLKPRLSELIQRTKSCIDRHSLLKSRDWLGLTVLQYSVFHGQFDALVTLVEHGASVHDEMTGMRNTSWAEAPEWYLQDVKELTVLDFARRLRHCDSDQREAWFRSIRHEVSMEDMDRIIEYLDREMKQPSEVPPTLGEQSGTSSAGGSNVMAHLSAL